jgi:hypothetical protein
LKVLRCARPLNPFSLGVRYGLNNFHEFVGVHLKLIR